MRCQDCVEKNVHERGRHIGKAEWILVDYDSVRLLCQGCYDEYCHIEGEINLDFFSLDESGLEQAFKKISGNLEFVTVRYRRLLKENSELKAALRKARSSTPKGVQMD